MSTDRISDTLNKFIGHNSTKTTVNGNGDQEVCDLKTGECYIIRSKDGLVERINKTFITEDGRQLLQD